METNEATAISSLFVYSWLEIYLRSGRATSAADVADASLPEEAITATELQRAPHRLQGADVQLKMSVLAKVDGQSCCGAGRGAKGPPGSDMRYASAAGQSAASRASFQTAAAYVLVAIA